MIQTIEKFFAILVKLLQYEANKHQKKCDHAHNKAHNHRVSENKALAKIKEAGGIYRTSLYAEGDAHARQADKAAQLANKIGGIIE